MGALLEICALLQSDVFVVQYAVKMDVLVWCEWPCFFGFVLVGYFSFFPSL